MKDGDLKQIVTKLITNNLRFQILEEVIEKGQFSNMFFCSFYFKKQCRDKVIFSLPFP